MKHLIRILGFSTMLFLALALPAAAQDSKCVQCHRAATPGVVRDWQAGKMGNKVDCATCHGNQHTTAADAARAKMPTASTCATCHEKKAKEFQGGKHAAAWVAMNAMPRTASQPAPMIDGRSGCGSCHSIGKDGGKCDSCHTRHTFSVQEARSPQACQTCHMGFDHPQWEMWSTSKHGTIYLTDKASGRAPTCQTCHMPKGDHGVLTAWGFLALRLPENDPAWLQDRVTILKALGVLDPQGNPTPRLDVVKAGNVARLTAADWQRERDKMVKICGQCHGSSFASRQLEAGDRMIKEADHLMAEAIEVVAGLYHDGIIAKPAGYAYAYPDLLTFYDAATPIEQKLYEMLMEYRMRAFQGVFHGNPDYAHWYGYAPLKTALVEVQAEAQRMRQAAGKPLPEKR